MSDKPNEIDSGALTKLNKALDWSYGRAIEGSAFLHCHYPSLMTFVTPTIHTKNTTLAHSNLKGERSFSRSIATTRA
jgi:hypothetical protein